MEISIHNFDNKLRISKQDLYELVRKSVDKIDLVIESCRIIFIGDETLREMHEEYLDDPDYTDVITFNLGEEKIEGEIYISLDRVIENARLFKVSTENEIYRTIIHGLLHLKGFNDKSEHEKEIMKHQENELLKSLQIY